MGILSAGTSRRMWAAGAATAGLLLSGMAAIAPPASAEIPLEDYSPPFVEGEHVTPTLAGCRASVDAASYTLLRPSDPPAVDNPFICDDSDYTTGNLGKGWNELDLVPHRLTTTLGSQAQSQETFDLIIAGDSTLGDYQGYDRVTIPQVNPALSDAAGQCTVVGVTDEAQEPDVTGGVDDAVYRIVRFSQTKGSTCVWDFDLRLSNSAADFSGSSLQAYMFESEDFSTGKRTVPIPVGDVEPQQLFKSATASRDESYSWNVWKTVDPNSITNSDTCEAIDFGQTVKVTVNYERVGPVPDGGVAYHAVITAENPAKRDIQVTVTDVIRENSATGDILAEIVGDQVTVPAGQTIEVLEVNKVFETEATAIYDLATGAYFDPVLQQDVDPDKTVDATSTVETGQTTNDRATVTDTESITDGFEFQVALEGEGGVVGEFGDWIDSTDEYFWSSEVTDSGSQVFYKNVRVESAGFSGTGTLSDVATIRGVDDVGVKQTPAETVNLIAEKVARFTLTKFVPDVLDGEESATFTFNLYAADGAGDPTGEILQTKTITFDGSSPADEETGNLVDEVTFDNLPGGTFVVVEEPLAGFGTADNVVVDLTGLKCIESVSMTNTVDEATATVQKVTDPAGFEAGWGFALVKPGDGQTDDQVLSTATTTGDGAVAFLDEGGDPYQLGEGSYRVDEIAQNSWESDGGSAACEFTVDLPADADKVFECTYTNTYAPTIEVAKEGDALAKFGDDPVDDATFSISATNTSTAPGENDAAGAPDLKCSYTDPAIGIEEPTVLFIQGSQNPWIGPGQNANTEVSYKIPEGTEPGEFLNTAFVTCEYRDGSAAPVNGTTEAVASNETTTIIFAPSVKVTKTTDRSYALVGQDINYTVTIENTSSAGTPDLMLQDWSDAKAPAGLDVSACETLAVGDDCTLQYSYTVAEDDGTNVKNTFEASYGLDTTNTEPFPNVVSDSAVQDVDIVRPNFTVTKDCVSTEPVPQEGPATFEVVVENTGNVPLDFTANDGIGTFSLNPNAKKTVEVSLDGPFSGSATADNTVRVTGVFDAPLSQWTETKEASGSCAVGSRVNITKLTQGVESESAVWKFELYNGPDGFGTEAIASDSTPPALLDFGNANLDPANTYTVCELQVAAGWTAMWYYNGELISYDNSTAGAVYNPNADDNPSQNLGNVCLDIGADTPYPLEAGATLAFTVDNTYPGGEPRTPGYWKNWASCTGGGQYAKTTDDVDPDNELWSLDEALADPGQTIGDLVLGEGDCVEAVRLLDKSDIETDDKKANDAAYELATALFAQKLNYTAGAEKCQVADNASAAGQALLKSIGFDGTGDYLTAKLSRKNPNKALRAEALELATTLDLYNNGELCS